MKSIRKQREPLSLVSHRLTQHATYANLDKTEVRDSLLQEQGYICCYCMRRIPEKSSNPGCKIEHYLCQEENGDKELQYSNMLLACTGQEGLPYRLQTCDSHKGNLILTCNPTARGNIELLIKYKSNGEIYSNDANIDNDLNKVLNLNVKTLKDNRRVMYEEIQGRIRGEGKRLGNKALKKSFLESEKEKLLSIPKGKYREYCMVGVYIIDKKLKKII